MSTSPPDPRDPAEEPDRDGAATGAAGDQRDDDALWASIVANYGDRARLEDDEAPEAPAETGEAGLRGDEDDPFPQVTDDDEPEGALAQVEREDHFVPPLAPPVPRTTPVRTLAWVGLFGVPSFVLLCLVLSVALPTWLGLLLMAWFVGGFVFLVASMRPDDHDDHGDGAVV